MPMPSITYSMWCILQNHYKLLIPATVAVPPLRPAESSNCVTSLVEYRLSPAQPWLPESLLEVIDTSGPWHHWLTTPASQAHSMAGVHVHQDGAMLGTYWSMRTVPSALCAGRPPTSHPTGRGRAADERSLLLPPLGRCSLCSLRRACGCFLQSSNNR